MKEQEVIFPWSIFSQDKVVQELDFTFGFM